MKREEIEEKVRQMLTDDLEIDEEKIAPEVSLRNDMGIDSLDMVEIVVIVNKYFGIKIKPEEMQSVKTMSEFCDYLETKLAGNN